MNKKLIYILLSSVVAISAQVGATGQKAHVHGLVTLTLAIENDGLEIEIESPADSLLGFEHKARSAIDKKKLKQTEKTLNVPKQLFSFEGADCKSVNTKIDLSRLVADEDHKDHDDDKHEDHADSHKDHDDHHDHKEDSHSEITMTYQFTCKNGKNLKSIAVNLFSKFPRIEKINAMWITEIGQGSKTLNASGNTIVLDK